MTSLYYDGINIKKYAEFSNISGFTMNSTFIKQSGFASYREFYDANSQYINNRPISLQVISDSTIIEDAKSLSSFGSNVYVKVSILNSSGNSNLDIIKTLLEQGIKINITCVYTKQQILDTYTALSDIHTPYIVSIFAGGISDTGVDPLPYIEHAVNTFKSIPNAQILWAGVKDNVAIKNSIKVGCHIITIPDSVMDRLARLDLDLHQMSIDKVKLFNTDAMGIRIEYRQL
jgi:transaldolase